MNEVRIVVTEEELIEFQRHAEEFAKMMENSDISPTFIKLVVNNLNPNLKNLDRIVELIKSQAVSIAVPQLIDSLINSDDSHLSEGLVYTTSELAQFFQVSQTTINKWINQGRFIGIFREPNKHTKINENVEWVASNGAKIKVKEIIEQYLSNEYNPPELSKEDAMDEILIELNALEQKYDGNIKENLLLKEELTLEQESDYGAWFHFSKMLKELNASD